MRDHPPPRTPTRTHNPDDAAARLRTTIARASRDRPHQATQGTLVIGARATDIEAILDALHILTQRLTDEHHHRSTDPTTTFDLDNPSPPQIANV